MKTFLSTQLDCTRRIRAKTTDGAVDRVASIMRNCVLASPYLRIAVLRIFANRRGRRAPGHKVPAPFRRRLGICVWASLWLENLALWRRPFACSVRRTSPLAACGSYKPSRRRFVGDQQDGIRAAARIAGPASDRPVACGSCALADVYDSAVRRDFLLRFWQAPTILCRQ